MLRSIKQLYGNKLGATDGDIGHVKDFYFDDHNWAIRYLVVDTGSWLPGREVLLSPRALNSLDQSGKVLRVNLTRKQIEQSPAMDSHKPVSRQYEEEYHRYYGWPYYWEGGGVWRLSGFPILELPQNPLPDQTAKKLGPQPERADMHLRSTKAVNGYHLQASDGIAGHVCDFLMDNRSWGIDRLAIKTGHRLSGKDVTISTKDVARIAYEESTVFVNLTSATVMQDSPPALMPVAAVI